MSPDLYPIAALPADLGRDDTGAVDAEASSRASQAAPLPGRRGAVQPSPPTGGQAEAAPFEFARVYDDHFAFVWRTLRLLGVAEPALEDAAQDVFATVSNKLAEFSGRSSLRTWVFAIVQRTAA